jgi:type I site-specific restriction endonuclease
VACYSFTVKDFHLLLFAQSPGALTCFKFRFVSSPLTRQERAEQVRKRDYFNKYGDQAHAVLSALLDKYADSGVEVLEDIKVLALR